MMKNDVAVGKNRTGVELHPAEKKGVLEVAEMTIPSMEGDESVLADARSEFASEGERIGTMPPPPSVKGAASQVVDAMKGANATVFLDKLGERLAFERTGTRLYEALIAKHASSEPLPGGPSLADLESIHRDELEHFELLRQAMLSLGADPTAMTPSADVAAVMSSGIVKVIADARTNMKQSLEAILAAELVDNDCWNVLVELARAGGHTKLVTQFEKALADEQRHLAMVRTWVTNATLVHGKSPGQQVKGAASAAASAVKSKITGKG